jgi:hypothetical protein
VAVNCAVYLLNRTTSRGTEGKSPYELWTGSKPSVSHLRTFGCVVFVKNTKPNMKKLEDRSKAMMFMGYEPGSTAYMCYDPVSKKVHISRDVILDEEVSWDWLTTVGAGAEPDFTIRGETEGIPIVVIEARI